MPNPVLVSCPEGVWTKVATNVTSGQVNKKVGESGITYFRTYRVTGDAAPTDLSTAVGFYLSSVPIAANVSEPIDVYIWCQDGDGSVVVEV